MIRLTSIQMDEMRRHGEHDYPFECCGLMLGRLEDRQKVVTATYPISNARAEEAKRDRFLIRPQELMRGEKYAREQGLDVVGIYHSHPDDAAIPSRYDLEHAWPTYSYIVIAVEQGRAADLRSWELAGDRSRFDEEEIVSPTETGAGHVS